MMQLIAYGGQLTSGKKPYINSKSAINSPQNPGLGCKGSLVQIQSRRPISTNNNHILVTGSRERASTLSFNTFHLVPFSFNVCRENAEGFSDRLLLITVSAEIRKTLPKSNLRINTSRRCRSALSARRKSTPSWSDSPRRGLCSLWPAFQIYSNLVNLRRWVNGKPAACKAVPSGHPCSNQGRRTRAAGKTWLRGSRGTAVVGGGAVHSLRSYCIQKLEVNARAGPTAQSGNV